MLHRNGTRLEIGTSDDVAELELVEARRLAETQRRHPRAGVNAGGPRTTGGSGSTVLSYGSVAVHTRTPGRAGATPGMDAPSGGYTGPRPPPPPPPASSSTGTATPWDVAGERGRATTMRATTTTTTTTTTTMASPGSTRGGSWRSPTATTNPSPSVVRPSYPHASSPSTGSPYVMAGAAGVRGGTGGGSGMMASSTALPYAGASSPDASATLARDISRDGDGRARAVVGTNQAWASQPQPYPSPYTGSSADGRVSSSGGVVSSAGGPRTAHDHMQWPPPPSAFVRAAGMGAGANAWDEELRRDDSEDMEPSPTRRSGLLPPE